GVAPRRREPRVDRNPSWRAPPVRPRAIANATPAPAVVVQIRPRPIDVVGGPPSRREPADAVMVMMPPVMDRIGPMAPALRVAIAPPVVAMPVAVAIPTSTIAIAATVPIATTAVASEVAPADGARQVVAHFARVPANIARPLGTLRDAPRTLAQVSSIGTSARTTIPPAHGAVSIEEPVELRAAIGHTISRSRSHALATSVASRRATGDPVGVAPRTIEHVARAVEVTIGKPAAIAGPSVALLRTGRASGSPILESIGQVAAIACAVRRCNAVRR